jgi:hypothetical protein
MRSFLAALKTLVLPYGKTQGARIIINGITGKVTVFDENGEETEYIMPGEGFTSIYQSPSGNEFNRTGRLHGASLTFDDGTYYQARQFGMAVADDSGAYYYHSLFGRDVDISIPVDGYLHVNRQIRAGRSGAPEVWTDLALPAGIVTRPGFDNPAAKILPHNSVSFNGTLWTSNGSTPANGSTIATILDAKYHPLNEQAIPLICNNGYTFKGLVRPKGHADAGDIVIGHLSPNSFNTVTVSGEYPLDR